MSEGRIISEMGVDKAGSSKGEGERIEDTQKEKDKEGEESKKKGRPTNVERLCRERTDSMSSIGEFFMWDRKRKEREESDGGPERDAGKVFQRSKKTGRSPVGKEKEERNKGGERGEEHGEESELARCFRELRLEMKGELKEIKKEIEEMGKKINESKDEVKREVEALREGWENQWRQMKKSKSKSKKNFIILGYWSPLSTKSFTN